MVQHCDFKNMSSRLMASAVNSCCTQMEGTGSLKRCNVCLIAAFNHAHQLAQDLHHVRSCVLNNQSSLINSPCPFHLRCHSPIFICWS